jgi:hypothetical protein
MEAKEQTQRTLLGKMTIAAFGGKLEWLDRLILAAGYLAPGRVMTKTIARFFAVTPQAVGLWHSKRGCPRNPDTTYDLRAVVMWREDQLEEDRGELVSGGTSPGLELYRNEKAALARMDRMEREAVLLPLEQVRAGNIRLASILRSAGEQLQREFGNEAAAILHDALVDFEAEAKQVLG